LVSAYPNTTFLDIDQPLPCVTEDGRADPSGTCDGGTSAIPSNYTAVSFAVDEGAYLAGVIAAAASRDDSLGIISGTAACRECNRYIDGFVEGARSVKPEITVQLAYLADIGGEAAFGDVTSAKTFAKAFIDVYEPDVVLPLTGSGSRGVIEAACEAGIFAVGTDIDVSTVHPELAECVLTSVAKDIEFAVRESIFAFANRALTQEWLLGLDEGHVAVTDEWTRLPGLPVDLSERYALAEQAILTGQVETCPTACAASTSPDEPAAPEEIDAPEEPVETVAPEETDE
jgi:basic membrane protein A